MASLVGRARELGELAGALADAAAGRGRLLLVSGPPGIGKSRLVDAALERGVALGLAVGAGHAVDDPGAPPLWPWRRALSALGLDDALAAAPGDDLEPDAGARFRRFTAVADRLAGGAGTLIVLEDLHWADELSVALLRHLAAELHRLPLTLLATYRDTGDGPLFAALGDLVRGDAVRTLGLVELSADEVAAWLPALGVPDGAGLAATLHERTGGNPLLVRLVAEHLAARSVPLAELMTDRPQLRRLVLARLHPLGPAARRLVDAAAVLGERLPADLLEATAGARSADGLDEAVAAGVLTAAGGEVRFVHALVRDAVYAELAERTRAELHRAAAEQLARFERPELAGSVAFHWQRAGGGDAWPRCQQWAERADDHARSALGAAEAATYAELAVEAARNAGAEPIELARLLVRLAEALALRHDMSAALTAAEDAAGLAGRHAAPELLARAALVAPGVGDPELLHRVRRLCEAALGALPEDALTLRARVTAQLAVCCAEHDQPQEAGELAASALDTARRSGDAQAQLEAIAARHLTISVPQAVEERLALGREAVALGAAVRRPIAALWGHLWRADAALQLGNLPAVEAELAAIERVAQQHGSTLAAWHHHRYAAVVDQQAGRFAAAEEHDRAALELAHRMDDFSLVGMHHAFQIHLAVVRGSTDRLDADWEWFVDAGPPMPLVKICRVLVLAVEGRLDEARAALAPFRDVPERMPVGPRWYATMGQLAFAADLLDDAELAERVFVLLRPIAHYHSGDGSGGVFSHGANAGTAADVARVAGRYDDALALYADAAAMNDRVGARPFSALNRLGWARTLLARNGPGDVDEAARLLAPAVAELRRLDLPGPLATARSALAAVERQRPAGPALSAREIEVARLVAQARSNRQIADQLVLSERTVESHVRNVLTKLGFSTRTEIATWVVQQDQRDARAD